MTKNSMTETLISSPHPSPLGGEGKGEGRFGYWNLVIGDYLELGIW